MSAPSEPLIEYRLLTPGEARRDKRRRVTRRALTVVLAAGVVLSPSPLRFDYVHAAEVVEQHLAN